MYLPSALTIPLKATALSPKSYARLASPLGWHVIPTSNGLLSLSNLKKGRYPNFTSIFEYSNTLTILSSQANQTRWTRQRSTSMLLTQPFYTSNLVRDLYYRYGFDEVSGSIGSEQVVAIVMLDDIAYLRSIHPPVRAMCKNRKCWL